MNLFIDASAIIAMLARESDAREIADRLDEHSELLWSPIVSWEVVAALTRIRKIDPSAARSDVFEFSREYELKLVTIGDWENEMAFQAFRLYGKGTGHRARLNIGDCFAYACAKAHQARLLYKGDDFAHTDLA